MTVLSVFLIVFFLLISWLLCWEGISRNRAGPSARASLASSLVLDTRVHLMGGRV